MLPYNSFLETMIVAQCFHYPFVLNPDHFWQIIAHGLAIHIKEDSEALRHQFVDFEGKKKVVIERPDFTLNLRTNNWESVIDQFGHFIKKNTKTDI